jgi:hypothetical protein
MEPLKDLLADLDVESLDVVEPLSEVGLESLRMGHGLTELGASCCCACAPCVNTCCSPPGGSCCCGP